MSYTEFECPPVDHTVDNSIPIHPIFIVIGFLAFASVFSLALTGKYAYGFGYGLGIVIVLWSRMVVLIPKTEYCELLRRGS